MSSTNLLPAIISAKSLPRDDTVFFKNSTFFKRHILASLPSTAQIRAAALPGLSRSISLFPSLSLAVKHVIGTSLAEGQCLWALRRFVPEVRVPEVYGWRREGKDVYLFMELVNGVTLAERWPSLEKHEKTAICTELGTMVRSLKRLQRPPEEKFIGAIGGQASGDKILFGRVHEAFSDIRTFYKHFMQMSEQRAYEVGMPRLPLDAPIVFTHGDLNFSNVIVSRTGARVEAIIDWEQAGWMPQFWEPAKVQFLLMWDNSDVAADMGRYLPSVVGNLDEALFMAFASYVQTWGGIC